jgi:hypothetical protein
MICEVADSVDLGHWVEEVAGEEAQVLSWAVVETVPSVDYPSLGSSWWHW